MKPEISIIMPVYNGEKYLDEAISSVTAQTFTNFELICINDSSTDNSEEILKKYSAMDNRISYYTKNNEGPGAALNFGITKATGEYLCFIDQDDKYSPSFLTKMFDCIKKTQCDLCICNAYFWQDNILQKPPFPEITTEIVSIKNIKDKKRFSGHYFPQWNKIIKKAFWQTNKISFPQRSNKAHDVEVHYQLISLCDHIGFVADYIYMHRIHENQISYNFDTGLYFYLTFKNMLLWLEKTNTDKKHRKKIKKFLLALVHYSASATKNPDILTDLIKIIKENYILLDKISTLLYLKHKLKKLQSL